jgi:hypothetical protein
MTSDNFDFGGDIEDDRDVNPQACNESEDTALSVYGLLVNRLGFPRAKRVYDALLRIAQKAAQQHDGQPGILFDVEGGRFVSIRQTE